MDKVLILARDEVVAALLGLMVELQGFTPMFPDDEESPEGLLAGDRYHAVIIDCDHPRCNEDLIEAIRSAAAQPVLFSPFRQQSELQNLADRHHTKSFSLPTDPETFARILAS